MTTPQWRDAPDQPGYWVMRSIGIDGSEDFHCIFFPTERELRRVPMTRYFGPIPPDSQQEQA